MEDFYVFCGFFWKLIYDFYLSKTTVQNCNWSGRGHAQAWNGIDFQWVIKRGVETWPKKAYVSTLLLKWYLTINKLRILPWPRPDVGLWLMRFGSGLDAPRRRWNLWRFASLIPSGCRLPPIHKARPLKKTLELKARENRVFEHDSTFFTFRLNNRFSESYFYR